MLILFIPFAVLKKYFLISLKVPDFSPTFQGIKWIPWFPWLGRHSLRVVPYLGRNMACQYLNVTSNQYNIQTNEDKCLQQSIFFALKNINTINSQIVKWPAIIKIQDQRILKCKMKIKYVSMYRINALLIIKIFHKTIHISHKTILFTETNILIKLWVLGDDK